MSKLNYGLFDHNHFASISIDSFGSSRISGKFDISKQIRYFTKPPPVPLLEKGEAIRHLTSAPPPCMSEGPTNSVKVVAFFCQGHYGS